MNHTGLVVRTIERESQDMLDRLAGFGVATVHEAQGRSGLLNHRLRPIQSGIRIAGSAITVLARPGDNWMLHVAVELVQPGDILVVAVSSECSDGMFGDLIATSLMQRGCAGLVIDAGVRDVADLRAIGFPVWARRICAQGTVKASLGAVNVPVMCGGVAINPGDALVADDDGAVVVRRSLTGQVVEACVQRQAREVEKRDRLAAGLLALDLDDMRDTLASAGLRYVEGPIDWERGESGPS